MIKSEVNDKMDYKNHGILILEKTGWASNCAVPGYQIPSYPLGIQSSNDPENFPSCHCVTQGRAQSRYQGKRSGKRSIFDIFWEQFHTPVSSRINDRWTAQTTGCVETETRLQEQPWAVHLGCYNVYM